MNAQNLGVIFGPSLFPPQVSQFLSSRPFPPSNMSGHRPKHRRLSDGPTTHNSRHLHHRELRATLRKPISFSAASLRFHKRSFQESVHPMIGLNSPENLPSPARLETTSCMRSASWSLLDPRPPASLPHCSTPTSTLPLSWKALKVLATTRLF